MQVVTSENFQQLVQTGKVPEFISPEPAKADAKVDEKVETKTEPARDESGKFVEANTDKKETSPEDENYGSDLSEKVRKQIGAKHRVMKEAEEFAKSQYLGRRAAEERAAELERENAELKAKSRPAPVEEKAEPKPEDFKTVAEYTDALTDYKVEKKFKAEQERLAREKAEAEAKRADDEFRARVAKAKEKLPDFEEVMEQLASTERDKMYSDVLAYMKESDLGPQLMYHLATHPEELDRINKLSPRRAIAALGKLEEKLEAPKSEAKPNEAKPEVKATLVSQAPPPITPIEGKSAPVHKDPATMSFKELREYERQQEATRRARR